MSRTTHYTGLKITVLTVCLILLPALHAYARLELNGIGDGYVEPLNKGLKYTPIEQKVITNAGYFLKAHSGMMHLSRLYELSDRGVDFEEWRQVTERTAAQIKAARKGYMELFLRAKGTPYKKNTLMKLEGFDYEAYGDKHRLNREIFQSVQERLAFGDIDGVSLRMLKGMARLETMFKQVEQAVQEERLPELELVWRINDQFSRMHLFGMYVARVFHEINRDEGGYCQ